jgi:hypothetical protein
MNLLQQLLEIVGEPRDLEAILIHASGGSSRKTSDRSVDFLCKDSGTDVFATLQFNKHGKLSEVIPGPSLREGNATRQLLDQARRDTSRNHGSIVHSRVIASRRNIQGFVQGTPDLRLGPVPSTAPIGKGLDGYEQRFPWQTLPPHLGPPFPLLLEVRTPRSPNGFLQWNWAMRALDAGQHLLALLLVGALHPISLSSDKVWVLVGEAGSTENHLLSQGFITDVNSQHDDFLPREQATSVYAGDDYYNKLWPAGHRLEIPATLFDDLARVDLLPSASKASFLRACYWYANGLQFRHQEPTALISMATAIECLLPVVSEAKCGKCQKPIGPGPTKLFRHFLTRYTTLPPELEDRKSGLYNVRSKLVHGGHGAPTDFDFFSGSRHDNNDLMLMDLVVQTGLIGWLRDDDRDSGWPAA